MYYAVRLSPKIGLLDDGHAFGFPFAFYFEWIGSPRETAFVWPEAVLNLLIGFVCSLFLALACRGLITSRTINK